MSPDEKKLRNDGVSDYGSLHIDLGIDDCEVSGKKRFGFIPHWYFSELWEVFNIAWSMVLVAIFFMLMGPISLIFAGQLGTIYLDGVGLANTILNIFGIMIGQGMATACDTLFSQAFGSSNKKKVGLYLQRALVILMITVLPSYAFLVNTESVLILMGQQPEIAEISGRYALIFLPALPAQFTYSILSKYLRNQNVVRPIMFIGFSGLAMNALCQFIFVTQLNMGIDGSALSQVFGFWTLAGGTLSYILISKVYKNTWDGWTWELFQDWGSFLKLAVAGLLMVSLQFWAFEAGTLIAGTLGEIQLAAQSIIFQLESITYMIPIGIGVGCNIRVGHLLGANRPIQASRSVVAGYTLSWTVAIIIVILLIALRQFLPMAFSQDRKVIDLAGNLLPILALYHIFDCTAGVSTGVLRGCGRQTTAASVVFFGMYLIGLPAGISMMLLTDLKTAGFWWGMTIAMFCEGIAYFISVYRTDWDKQAKLAQIRAGVFPKKKGRFSVRENDQSVLDGLDETDVSTDEKRAILGTAPLLRSSSQKRLYCGEYVSSQPDISVRDEIPQILTASQVIFRRTLFLLCALFVLGLGIFARLYFSFPRDMTRLCLPYVPVNGTIVNDTVIMGGNFSVPFCNNSTSL
ncbi:multidrug and toxin extrusion protein 1-like [Lineus longissimus]|uniref:multidrug and toxin extrusion protein 1-like n=1 Tax=Lineus longissimus TaxID=88925 RepID=UPI002B4D88AC